MKFLEKIIEAKKIANEAERERGLAAFEGVFYIPLASGQIHFEVCDLDWIQKTRGMHAYIMHIDPPAEANEEHALLVARMLANHQFLENCVTSHLGKKDNTDPTIDSNQFSALLAFSQEWTQTMAAEFNTKRDEFLERMERELRLLKTRGLVMAFEVTERVVSNRNVRAPENPDRIITFKGETVSRPYITIILSREQNKAFQAVLDEAAKKPSVGQHSENVVNIDGSATLSRIGTP